MSQLRKREHGSETGAAPAVMVIVRNKIRLRLKVERGMAAPFQQNSPSGTFCVPSVGHTIPNPCALTKTFQNLDYAFLVC